MHCSQQSLLRFLPVILGVPHWSILGPSLFIFYSHNLHSVPSFANVSLYADDSKCLGKVTSSSDSVLIQAYSDSLNTAKSFVLPSTHPRSSPITFNYVPNGKGILVKNSCKDLGVTSSNLA